MIGVIGGSGLYELFGDDHDASGSTIRTPYGSAIVTVGRIGGRDIAFLPRHGRGHSVPPHRIDARSAIWALRSLGVRALISTAAVGSLDPRLPVGTLCVADQLVDHTHGRADTFFDDDLVRHLPFADPFDHSLRTAALGACPEIHDGATVLVIQGPRFSTRAESRINRAAGIDLVNMTLYPEVALAAELGIDTVALCLVTDLDSGHAAAEAVTAEAVFAVLAEARPRMLSAIARIAAAVDSGYTGRQLIDPDAVTSVLQREPR